jgi:tagatose 6-phosphate kinase
MIVAVCLNPALDVTYRVSQLEPGTSHSVEDVEMRPGGKATNVARVLQQVNQPVTLIAPLGGGAGAAFRASLADVALVTTPLCHTTRTCVTVVDSDATVFNEPGPLVTSAEWDAIVATVTDTVSEGDVLVLSGSVPPGVADDAYAQLTRRAHDIGAHVIVDAKGKPLRAVLAAAPDVVAPNVLEVAAEFGTSGPPAAAAYLCATGVPAAVVSAGATGVYACSGPRAWHAVPPRLVAGNPTGAGDAVTAAIAAGMHAHQSWAEIVADAVTFGGAAVAAGVAGEIDLALRNELRRRVVVEEIE